MEGVENNNPTGMPQPGSGESSTNAEGTATDIYQQYEMMFANAINQAGNLCMQLPPQPSSDQIPVPKPITIPSPSPTLQGGGSYTSTNTTKPRTEIQEGRGSFQPDMDPAKLRRAIANRESSKRSRLKKIQQITELERKTLKLKAEVAALNNQITAQVEHAHRLKMENGPLHEKIRNLAETSRINQQLINQNKNVAAELWSIMSVQQMHTQRFQGKNDPRLNLPLVERLRNNYTKQARIEQELEELRMKLA
ncbi:Basic-leucine zipper domain [Dillenia turbinata]|uniref:Basic-leucine zipper domain n=1 Tax=Dillenia turbinata TaxID=194707 RepID=A0AAN8ZB45_9MAGN